MKATRRSIPVSEATDAGLRELAEQRGVSVSEVAAQLLEVAVQAARPPAPVRWRRVA